MNANWIEMSGTGNRFAVVDAFTDELREGEFERGELAREICAPENPENLPSLDQPGAHRLDGLLVVGPDRSGADCRMVLYNADGTRAEMCGNGLRCAAKLVIDRGHVSGEELTIETDCGPRRVVVERTEGSGGTVYRARVQMGRPKIQRHRIALGFEGPTGPFDLHVTTVDVGNPHCVLLTGDVDALPVESIGPAIATHPFFPEGVNAGFLANSAAAPVHGERRTPSRARLRVWERGVGETRSCGSGACAAAVVAHEMWGTPYPLTVEMRGGELVVDTDESDPAGGLTLAGCVEARGAAVATG